LKKDSSGTAPARDSSLYHGYDIHLSDTPDSELTRVGPGTPAGEYLRRYWHPVHLSAQLGERPKAIRILGEDLVVFRDGNGDVGLVHKRCPHRQASLEFGTCGERGIRCCYHGWHFDLDGTLLDTPGQPEAAAERLKSRVRLGAYPALEYKGLVFAYLGPVDQMPQFPIYDTMMFEDVEMVPYQAPFQCNWLQVLDAIVDPIHTSFLHSNISRVQFSEGFGEVGQMDFFERDMWMLGTNTRRVGDNVWFRVNELVLPNFTQAGAAFAADGTERRLYGRTAFTRWVVPIDDEHTLAIAWANFGDRGDPQEYNTPEGPELIEQGEVFDRTYEEKQRHPADAEACEGMGPINIHANENLAPSDKGVALMRRRLRAEIQTVAAGGQPMHIANFAKQPIPTYGGDTILTIPVEGDEADEGARLSALAHALVEAQFDADGLDEAKRMKQVRACIETIESDFNESAEANA
jgi:nitrite reductase/ring-hydroxylating ferredoxin subunit